MNKKLISLTFVVSFILASAFATNAAGGKTIYEHEGIREAKPTSINIKDITRILTYVIPEMETRAKLVGDAKDEHGHGKLKHDDQQGVDVPEQDHIANSVRNNNAIAKTEEKKVKVNNAEKLGNIVNAKKINDLEWIVRFQRGEADENGEGAVYEDYHITAKGYYADDTNPEDPKRYVVNDDGTKELVYSFDRTLELYGHQSTTSYKEYKDAGIDLKRNADDQYKTNQSIAYNDGAAKPYYSMGSAYYFGLFNDDSARHDIVGYGIATRIKRWSKWGDLDYSYEGGLIPFPCAKDEKGIDLRDANGNLIPIEGRSNWYVKGQFTGCYDGNSGINGKYDKPCNSNMLRDDYNLVYNADTKSFVYADNK